MHVRTDENLKVFVPCDFCRPGANARGKTRENSKKWRIATFLTLSYGVFLSLMQTPQRMKACRCSYVAMRTKDKIGRNRLLPFLRYGRLGRDTQGHSRLNHSGAIQSNLAITFLSTCIVSFSSCLSCIFPFSFTKNLPAGIVLCRWAGSFCLSRKLR